MYAIRSYYGLNHTLGVTRYARHNRSALRQPRQVDNPGLESGAERDRGRKAWGNLGGIGPIATAHANNGHVARKRLEERAPSVVDVDTVDEHRITSYNVCYTKLLRCQPAI